MEHHHDNYPEGQKPVSFTVPFIMACSVLLIIVLLLSVCDPKHGGCECKEDCSKECVEKCEKGDHSGHDEHGKEIKGAGAHHLENSSTEEHQDVQKDTAATAPEHHDH